MNLFGRLFWLAALGTSIWNAATALTILLKDDQLIAPPKPVKPPPNVSETLARIERESLARAEKMHDEMHARKRKR